MRSRRRHLFLLALLYVLPAYSKDSVRVRLFENSAPVAVVVSAEDGPIRLFAGDFENEIALLEAGQEAVIRRASSQLHVKIGATALYASSLRIEPESGARFGARVVEGTGISSTPAANAGTDSFDGRLFLSVDEQRWEIKLINEVNLENYVAAVVSREYGFDDPEGAKAMAVITRTYTLAALGRFGPDYDHVDNTLSQVYRGIDRITPVVQRAVEETRGQILSYNGQLIQAVYFSASGGHTVDNEDVWQAAPLPYLRGKPDPYGKGSPDAAWTSRVSRPRLLATLSAAFAAPVSGFVISERTKEGRVTKVDLLREDGGRKTVRSNDFRMAILRAFGPKSLRSTLFEARKQGDEYVFEGSGNGHGVGLSQWGAHDMSQRGSSYRDILQFYYTGVKLEMLADLDSRKQQPEMAATKAADEPKPRLGW